eukprot:5866848-Pyramimonas_sp.AAC.2
MGIGQPCIRPIHKWGTSKQKECESDRGACEFASDLCEFADSDQVDTRSAESLSTTVPAFSTQGLTTVIYSKRQKRLFMLLNNGEVCYSPRGCSACF